MASPLATMGMAAFSGAGVFVLLLYLANPVPASTILTIAVVLGNLALFAGAALRIATREDLRRTQKMVWLGLSLVGLPVVPVGALAYLFLGRERTARLLARGT